MKLSFDKSATRKLELWATSKGFDMQEDDTEGNAAIIASLVVDVVSVDLRSIWEAARQPTPPQPEKGVVGS